MNCSVLRAGRWILVATIHAMLLAPAAAAPAALPAAQCRILQIAELPVVSRYNRILAPGEINGQKVKILLDTGAALSTVLRPAAKRLGLHLLDASHVKLYGVGGEAEVQLAGIDELRLDQFAAHKLTLAVAGDMDGDFDMVLGEDFFAKVTVEFDLAHGFIRLLQPRDCKAGQLAYWSRTYSLAELSASTEAANAIQTTVLLNGKAVRAEIDSGATVSVVSTIAAERAGVTRPAGAAAAVEAVSGFGKQALVKWVGTFGAFSIGDETIQNARLKVADMNSNIKVEELGSRIARQGELIPKMLIGVDFLQSHRVVVAGADRKLLFTYEGGPVFQTVHETAPHPAAATAPADSPPVAAESAPR